MNSKKHSKYLLPLLSAVLILFLSSFIQGSSYRNEKVNWIDIEDLDAELKKENSKPVIIDVYTDWCGWCKYMDKNTFNSDEVSAYLNENFHAVKFNAEVAKEIEFQGHKYGIIKEQYSELAVAMLDGKMSFPAIIYMDKDGKFLSRDLGYKTKEQIMPILKFIKEKKYETMTMSEYIAKYATME